MLGKDIKNSSADLIDKLGSQDSGVERQIVILSFASENLMAGTRDCLKMVFSKKNYTVNTFNLKSLARQKSQSLKKKGSNSNDLNMTIKKVGSEIKPLLSKDTIIYVCCHGYVNDIKGCYAENSKDDEADSSAEIKKLFSVEQLADFIKQMLGDDLASVENIKLFICYSARSSDYRSHHIKSEIDPSDSFLAEFSQRIAFDDNYVKVTGYTGPVRPDAMSEGKILIGTEKLILDIHPLIKKYRIKSEQTILNALPDGYIDTPYSEYIAQYISNDMKLNAAFDDAVSNIMFIVDPLMKRIYAAMPETLDLEKEIESLLDPDLSNAEKELLMPALKCNLYMRISETLKGESVAYYDNDYGEVTFTMNNGEIERIEMASKSENGQTFQYEFEFSDQENNEQQRRVVPASFAKEYEDEYDDKWQEDIQEPVAQTVSNQNANNSFFSKCVIL